MPEALTAHKTGLAVAEMYVQSVPTRRVQRVTREFYGGLEINSLGVSRAAELLDEQLEHWREFLISLQERGLHGVKLTISDDPGELEKARIARFTGIAYQRCQFLLQQNAPACVPRGKLRREVAAGPHEVFNAQTPREAKEKLGAFVVECSSQRPIWRAGRRMKSPRG